MRWRYFALGLYSSMPETLPVVCDISAAHYRQIIQSAVSHGYRVQSLAEYHEARHSPVVIVRHDVDVSLKHAIAMAKIERELGATSTYFIRIHAEGYNPFTRESYDRLCWLLAEGFELGLHHEIGIFPLEGAPHEQLARELSVLEAVIGRPVRSIAMHLPKRGRFPLSDNDLRANGIHYEAGAEIFNEGATFISDSNRTLKPTCPCTLLGKVDKLYAQIHPIWWMAPPIDPEGLRQRLIRGG